MQRIRLRRWAAGLSVLTGIVFAQPTLGTTYRITEFADDAVVNGNCTLREAIAAANTNTAVDDCRPGSSSATDRITLLPGVYPLDLSSLQVEDDALTGDLDVSGDLIISGLTPQHTVIDGGGEAANQRVFDVRQARLALRSLTVSGGNARLENGGLVLVTGNAVADAELEATDVDFRAGAANSGGALAIGTSALVTLRYSVIDDNAATLYGGGIANFSGTLELIHSRVSGNTAGSDGGGIYALSAFRLDESKVLDNAATGEGMGGGEGGGIFASGGCEIEYTVIRGNRSAEGAGVWFADNPCEIRQSALIDNVARLRGGGLLALTDGFVRRSTVAFNEAPNGGGALVAAGATLFDHVTMVANVGGGLVNEGAAFSEVSLFADNVGGNCVGMEANAFGAFNLEDADTCGLVDSAQFPNFPNTEPLLGPLAENGGPTPTMALLPGSPAIDGATTEIQAGCENSPDQRGYPRGRPRQDGATPVYFCDIGAYEVVDPHRVDSLLDEPDADADDDLCLSAGGNCTLRAAVEQANATPGFEDIIVPAGEFGLQLGPLALEEPVAIHGGGASVTAIAGLGTALFSLAHVDSGGSTSPGRYVMRDVSLINGNGTEAGGAVATSHSLLLERVHLAGNNSQAQGGAVYCHEDCRLTVVDSRFVSNVSMGNGGAMYQIGSGLADVRRTVLAGNQASLGAGGEFTRLLLDNSIVASNSAGSSGGFFSDRAAVTNSTIVENATTGDTGGIFLISPSTLRNTIVALNTLNDAPSNCSLNPFALTSLGFNLSDGDDCELSEVTDLTGTDPLLSDSGVGSLQLDSPAIDAGDDGLCPATDVFRVPRPQDGDDDGAARCDIGAVEVIPLGGADLLFRNGFEEPPVN